MKCIKVYPILKKTFSDSLTYWISGDVQIGDIIEAPLQNRKIWVVVDSVVSVHEAKEFIKSQTFTIRKIDAIKKLELFSLDFIFAVLKTANYYIVPFGEVFSELIPKKILENLTNDIELKKDDAKEINVFPIKEYMSGDHAILPIDLYKADTEHIKTINVYYAESEYYRHLFKKFDYRFFIREFAARKKIRLNEIETKLNIGNKNLYIIDQSAQNRASLKKKNADGEAYRDKLNLISPELFSALKKIEKNGESVFLYTIKKGFAPKTICPDCKHVMKCPQCFEDLEITLDGEKYAYTCKNNHRGVPIDAHCPICDNQNLLSLGASIEVVYKEIQKEFDIDIVKFDNEHDTKGQIKKYFDAYLENQKPTIFIGNDYALNQIIGLDLTFDNFAIISLESLFAIPLYGMEHQIYQKIALISNHVNKNLIIQTRDSGNPFWKHLKDSDVDAIKNDAELKKLSLPPYKTHIQVLVKTEKSTHVLKTIKAYLESHVPYFEVVEKLKTTLHIMMDKKEFEQSSITQYLKSLPPYIHVEVDSRNLL